MARFLIVILLVSSASTAQLVERSQSAPQTPRQALLEILRSKDASAIERHLPEITRKKLREFSTDQESGLAMIMPGRRYGRMHGAIENLEVFDAGPILARVAEAGDEEILEIAIESEDFRGDESDLELAFHLYKKGEEVTAWYMPRVLLNMKEEHGIWRIAEVGFTAKLRFSNPEFLESMAKEFRQTRNQMALANLRAVLTAQTVYLQNYPEVGYACSLVSLGSGGGDMSKRVIGPLQASLIDNSLASGRKDGHTYGISNCTGRPATSFTVTAVPEKRGPGTNAYCSNESGVIRYSTDGRAETCLTNGKGVE